MNSRPHAFTLIELLIVVAIIAILAAIAVPNFLEAQTRAKVTRAKADMRSISTAIEAYRADNNWVPELPGGGGLDYLKWENYFTHKVSGIGRLLTTPVAYISNIPYDTFNTQMYKNLSPHHNVFRVLNASVFYRGSMKGVYTLDWPRTPADAPLAIHSNDNLPQCYYIISSAGPDLIPWPQDRPVQTLTGNPNAYTDMDYDPTNGTISSGDIWRTDVGSSGGGN
jgi:type II secretion system protein G